MKPEWKLVCAWIVFCVALIGAGLTACGHSETPLSQAAAMVKEPVYDPKVLSYAALDVIEKALPIDTTSDDPLPNAEGLCDLKLIAAEREWVRASIKDTEVKAAYLKWIDYYDDQVHRRMNTKAAEREQFDTTPITRGRELAADLPALPGIKEQCK
jgi:hypothetical protein